MGISSSESVCDPYDAALYTCLVLLSCIGIYLQSTVYLSHDVGWILRSASWLFDGKQLGRDIVDSSPPLIWFFSLPPAAFARFTGLSEPMAFRLYTFALAAAVLLLCSLMLKPFCEEGFRFASVALLLSFAFAVIDRAGSDFGQREYLAVLLGMPYLLLVGGLLRGYSFKSWLSITTGVLAGLAFAFKPYFLFVPIAVESYRLAATGRLKGVIRYDTCAMAGVILVYAVSILIFAPAYVMDVVPLLMTVYNAYQKPVSEMISGLEKNHQVAFLAIGLIFLLGRRKTSYEAVLGAGAIGFLASYFVQMKGWSYHSYPFFTLFFVFACLAAALVASEARTSNLLRLFISSIMLVVVLTQVYPVAIWYKAYNTKSGYRAYETKQVIQAVQKYAAGQTVYAFSTHPYPGFPTVNYTSAKWGGRAASQFMIPALVQQRASGRPLTPALRRAEIYLREMVLCDFRTRRPAIVLVDVAPNRAGLGRISFDDVGYYTQDRRFAKIWKQFEEVEPVGNYRVFVRRDVLSTTEGNHLGQTRLYQE